MLCTGYQSDCSTKKTNWSFELKKVLLSKKDIDIIPLPCPEFFYFRERGLVRKNHGVSYYESLDDFVVYCEELSKGLCKDISFFIRNDYKILAIIGVEHSPTCAVNYMYTNKGTVRRKGIFYKKILEELTRMDIEIPFLGVNRNAYAKTIDELERLISTNEKG